MDTRRIDEVDPEVSFDLLKTWVSNACTRRVDQGPGDPSGWASLVSALGAAARQRQKDHKVAESVHAETLPAASSTEPTETELRLRLVHAYRAQSAEVRRAVIAAKLRDPLSFFSKANYKEKVAEQHWSWYLHCLCVNFEEFHVATGVLRMPLDFVDLQFVAQVFQRQITVSRLMESAVRFPPARGASPKDLGAADLVFHRGLWAPLLDVRSPQDEPVPLVGAIVQLGDLAGRLERFSDCIAAVQRHDPDLDVYHVSLAERGFTFPVDRCQIRRFVHREAECEVTGRRRHARHDKSDNAGELLSGDVFPPFQGVPDGSLEFHLLHELVRRDARARLLSTIQELAGRANRREVHAESRLGRSPATRGTRSISRCLPHQVTWRRQLSRSRVRIAVKWRSGSLPDVPVCVKSPSCGHGSEHQLKVSMGDELPLSRVGCDGVFVRGAVCLRG